MNVNTQSQPPAAGAVCWLTSRPKIRQCSRCGMKVVLMLNPRANKFEVAHLTEDEPLWRCPKAPIFVDETPSSNRRKKTMTDAAGNTVRQSKYQLSSLPATALFRWFGAKGFTYPEVAKYVTVAGIAIPSQTVKRHIIDGAHGDGTKAKSGRTIPVLTDEQVRELLAYKIDATQPVAVELLPDIPDPVLTAQLEQSVAAVKGSKKAKKATTKAKAAAPAPAPVVEKTTAPVVTKKAPAKKAATKKVASKKSAKK